MKIVSFITDPSIIYKILKHLGLLNQKSSRSPPAYVGSIVLEANNYGLELYLLIHFQFQSRFPRYLIQYLT